MSNSDKAYWDSYYASAYPSAIQLKTTFNPVYSSSRLYNCHGFAWYMSESEYGITDPRWIGYSQTTDEDIYMTDGSYIQVSSATFPGKVSWGSGDHSAITTSTPGVFISKWNMYPLMQHRWDDTPYGTRNLKYYVKNCTIFPEKRVSQLTFLNLMFQSSYILGLEFGRTGPLSSK